MPLNLYRRHRQQCTAGHAHNSRSGELEERSKKWKRCACPIFAAGTLRGKFRRQSTARWEWEPARVVAAAWESAGRWDSPAPSAILELASNQASATIENALHSYLAHHEASGISQATLHKYRMLCKRIREFGESKGYRMMHQFTTADMDWFYSNWKIGPRTKANELGRLRNLFRYCAKRKWVQIDPTDPKAAGPVSSDLKRPKESSRATNKVPFTDAELDRIFAVCEKIGTVKWKNGNASGSWSGEDVKDFISLMLHSGLRISDAALFNTDRMRGNEVFLRAKKNGGDVFCWLPDELVARLKRRSFLHGRMPFRIGDSLKLETVTDLWRRRINKVFDLAGRFEERPTPHKFRHTFARVLLERGVALEDVAVLLGDDEKTVRLNYARWVPTRQARLTSILQEAFQQKAASEKVVEMHPAVAK